MSYGANLVTTLIAGYAALVATGTLVWQIWNTWRARRPRVSVMLDDWLSSQPHGRRFLDEAKIRIRNREDHAVRVDKVYFRYPGIFSGRPISAVIRTGDANKLPFDVPGREVMSFTLRPTGQYAIPRPNPSGREFTPLLTIELRTGERDTSRAA